MTLQKKDLQGRSGEYSRISTRPPHATRKSPPWLLSAVFPVLVMAGGLHAQTASYIGPDTTNNDRWNLTSSWSTGAVPAGSVNVAIPAGKFATAWSDATPVYSGNLSIGANATLQMGWSTSLPASFHALGTPGETVITLANGAQIRSRTGSSFTMPEIQLTGDATVTLGTSTQAPSFAVFDFPVTGAHGFTIQTNASGGGVELNAANTFASLAIQGVSGRGGSMPAVAANVAGALGAGDVTIEPDAPGGRSPQLRFHAEGAMSIAGSLVVNGEGPAGNGAGKIHLATDAMVRSLQLNGVDQPPGNYSRAEANWISGDGTLVVLETVAGTSETLAITRTPVAGADDVYVTSAIEIGFNRIITANPGTITLRNLTDGNDLLISTEDPRVSISKNTLTVENDGLLQWGKAYAIRISPGAIEDANSGTPFSGIADDTTWAFTTLPGDPLVLVASELKNHITGAATLTPAQIEERKFAIDAQKPRFAATAETIAAVFDLVATYDAVVGPLWIARGEFSNRNTQPNDLDWTIYHVMQYIMDEVYGNDTLAAHAALIDGFKFGSSAHFPGACPPPADPTAAHSVMIQASFERTFGRNTQQWTLPARKPTGTYLAPGTIATVTVPAALADAGYQIRVGAHSWDLSGRRNQVRRLDRATIAYDITATTMQVASPYGGGIYIEVPIGADAGVVEVTVTGAVRAPYFSAKSFHQTTLQQWLDTERHHPAPWADFQSDKFMMQVPTGWVNAHPDPVALMEDWDKAMDAQNDLMGFPRIRGKETMYCQVDVIMRSSVHAPGYPAVNVQYSPNSATNGYANNYLVRGPGMNHTAAWIEIHEQGHAYFFPKFGGENEALVNLPHVAVMQRKFGFDWDTAFRGSLGSNNPHRTLDNTAVEWMTSFNFSPREVAMHVAEKSYQLKGHAKYVEIARLFGWDVLGDFWRSFMEDDANGVSYSTNTDALLLRLSTHVGYDIRPLFHFWGVIPQDNEQLGAALSAEGIPRSEVLHDLLVHYQSLIPADNAAFRTYGQAWWGKSEPSINGAWTETEHARQWDERIRRAGDGGIRTDITIGEMYIEACAAQIEERVQQLIDFYFPEALNPDPMEFAIAPAAIDETTIGMQAVTANAAVGPIEYFFENLSNGDSSGWTTSTTWHNGDLLPGVSYAYHVKARDGDGNETDWSAAQSAVTATDLTPPSPDPMSFNSPPLAIVLEVCCTSDHGNCGSCLAVTMTAAAATDINGVEYYFEAVGGLGTDSGWQESRTYTDRDLLPNTTYTYRVRARDQSAQQNLTGWSEALSASTGDAPDNDPPEIVTLYPATGTRVESPDVPLVVVFDESVEGGSGSLILKNLTDGTQLAIAVDGPEVTIFGDTLTVQPPDPLEFGKQYAVRIDPGLVVDLSGNPFTGITDDLTWVFDTFLENPLAAPGGPYVVDVDGALDLDAAGSAASGTATLTSYAWDLNGDGVFGDATGVAPASIDFQTLQDAWEMTAGVNTIALRVTDSDGKSATATAMVILRIAEVTPGADFLADAAAASDDAMHWADLVPGNPTGFGLLLDKSAGNEVLRGAVEESATLLTHAFRFPGGKIGNLGGALLVNSGTTTARSFQHAGWHTHPVSIEIWFRPDAINPPEANGQILFETGGSPGLGFFVNNQSIQFRKISGGGLVSYNLLNDPAELRIGDEAGDDFIQVIGTFDTDGGHMAMYVNGRLVGTASPGGSDWSTADAAAFGTRGGSNTGGLGNGQQNTASFAGDIALIRAYRDRVLTPAEVENNFKAVSAIDEAPPEILALTPENESTGVYPAVQLTAVFNERLLLTGGGEVVLKNLDDPSGASDVVLALPHAAVGVDEGTLTITPAAAFDFATHYAIRISGDALRDVAGNPFPGIADDATWSFTTAAQNLNPPAIIARSPGHQASGVSAASQIVATFDQDLLLGAGEITLFDLADNVVARTIPVTDAAQVWLSGNTLTITPAGFLEIGRSYAVRIPAGAVRNFSDVGFPGIAGNSEWVFHTVNLTGELGILDLAANGGINPATGVPWQAGDSYRLVFISSDRLNPRDTVSPSAFGSWDDIATWNAEAQKFANQATGHDLSGATWKVLGSSVAVHARDNTLTNPALHGSGHPILLIDGRTIIAANFQELWSGEIRHIIDLTENAGQTIAQAPSIPWPFTGTNATGARIGNTSALRNISSGGNIRQGEASTTQGWIDRANRAGQAAASSNNPNAIYVMSDALTVQALPGAPPPSLYELWTQANGLADDDALPAAILRSDGFTNLQKFAFGMDPAVATFGALAWNATDGSFTVGAPTLMNAAPPGAPDAERAIFTRLKNHAEAGVTYTVEFSADLRVWTDGAVAPTVISAADAEASVEVVSVPFPELVPVHESEQPRPARFMRIRVEMEE